MSRTHTQTRVNLSFQSRLEDVAAKAAALHDRAEHGEPMGPREVTQAIEYNEQYIDILKEMETAPISIDPRVTVGLNGKRLRFPNINALANWIAEVMD